MQGHNSTVPLRNNFIRASFSPSKDTTFGVLYDNCFVLCEISPSYEVDDSGGIEQS